MTREELNLLLALLLTTLAEVGEAAEGILYAPICARYSSSDFSAAVALLARAQMIERPGAYLVRITPFGRQVAAKVDAATGKWA